jgi:predicted nucleotidyltransferase
MRRAVPTVGLNDPVLARFRAALEDIYGNEIARVILFGSRARGDSRPDSDYDVAVFLKSLPDRWAELDRLADLRVTFLDRDDAFFDARPYPESAYSERTPLMQEIRRDGLDL